MIRINESISKRTYYVDAVQALNRHGFKGVYHHEFKDPYNEEDVVNHFHIFNKESIVILLESVGQSLVTCETYISFTKSGRDAIHDNSRRLFDVYVFDFIYDLFTTLRDWNYDKLIANNWQHNGEDILRVFDYVETRQDGKYSIISTLDGTKEIEVHRRFMTMPESFLRLINYSGIMEKV